MKKSQTERFSVPSWLILFVLFTLIFIIYFSSSVGLINSGDSPQYFTTEALIQHQNVDLSAFKNDPHFFIWPDFFIHNGQQLSYRGYVLSVFMMPIHYISSVIESFYTIDNFPQQIGVPHFTYELSIVSLFTIFSVMGLMMMWRLIAEVTGHRGIASVTVMLMAMGTYIWKYSSYYARHGFIVFLLSASIYSLWKVFQAKEKKSFYFGIFLLCWVVSFGIDMVLFVSYSFIVLLLIFRNYKSFIHHHVFSIAVILLLIFFIFLNFHWYGSISSNQSLQSDHFFEGIPMSDRMKVAFSAPIVPTIYTVLFNFGKPSPSVFSHMKELPLSVLANTSALYASKYNFFGIFVVSPFLLFALPGFFSGKKRIRSLLWVTGFLFIANIAGNSKFYTFWGGNQYDIRYFYPFTILLALPVGLALQWIFKIKFRLLKIALLTLFGLGALFSILMGWLGVINMFAPALTGERKIWMDIVDFPLNYSRFSIDQYMNATFMNRENAWIAFVISCILLLFWRGIGYTWQKKNYVLKKK